jgi:hypothetical protein
MRCNFVVDRDIGVPLHSVDPMRDSSHAEDPTETQYIRQFREGMGVGQLEPHITNIDKLPPNGASNIDLRFLSY